MRRAFVLCLLVGCAEPAAPLADGGTRVAVPDAAVEPRAHLEGPRELDLGWRAFGARAGVQLTLSAPSGARVPVRWTIEGNQGREVTLEGTTEAGEVWLEGEPELLSLEAVAAVDGPHQVSIVFSLCSSGCPETVTVHLAGLPHPFRCLFREPSAVPTGQCGTGTLVCESIVDHEIEVFEAWVTSTATFSLLGDLGLPRKFSKGESLTTEIQYCASGWVAEPQRGEVIFSTRYDETEAEARIPIAATPSIPPHCRLRATPGSLVAAIPLGQTATATHRITNRGRADCLVTVELDPDQPGAFSLDDASRQPFSLRPRQDLPISLFFRPQRMGDHVVRLVFRSDDPIEPEVSFVFESAGASTTAYALSSYGAPLVLTPGTPLAFTETGGHLVARAQLPFTAELLGVVTSEVWIHNDGFISFEPSLPRLGAGLPLPHRDPPDALIALWWDVLDDATDRIMSAVRGSAPDRVFHISFPGLTGRAGRLGPFSGEIRIHERGLIEVHYGAAWTEEPNSFSFFAVTGWETRYALDGGPFAPSCFGGRCTAAEWPADTVYVLTPER